jgi:hypothetical protein
MPIVIPLPVGTVPLACVSLLNNHNFFAYASLSLFVNKNVYVILLCLWFLSFSNNQPTSSVA